jgi:GH18 family chitinase
MTFIVALTTYKGGRNMLLNLRTFFHSILLILAIQLPMHSAEIPLQLNYVVTTDWGSGYNVDVTVKNTSQSSIENWKATFDLPEGQSVSSLWDGVWRGDGQHISVENTSWNASLVPGASTTFGLGVVNNGANSAGIQNLTGSGFNSATPPPEETTAFFLEASYAIEGAWQEGFFAVIHLNNPTGEQVDTWVVEFDLPSEVTAITSLWGGNYVFNQGHVRITNPDCPDEIHIPASETKKIGFSVATESPTTPAIFNLSAAANTDAIPITEVPPEQPQLDPIASSGGNYTLRWHAVPNADAYILEEASLSDFTDAKILYQGSGTQHQVQAKPPGTYYYRVEAINQYGSSPYSLPQEVTIEDVNVLTPPAITSIQYDSARNAVTLHWNAVAGAEGYRVEESRNSGFNPFSVVYEGSAQSLEIPGGEAGTYYYRVKAFNGDTTSSPSSVESLVISGQNSDFKIVGYFPNWAMYRSIPFYPKDINPDQVTHVNYAFTRVDTTGNIHLFDPWADVEYRTDWNTQKPYHGHFGQFADIKAAHPELKTLVAVGGWTLSNTFSQVAEFQHTRENFARECVRFCKQYGFDGVDIDWEYPNYAEHNGRPIDVVNFTLLLEECDRALKAENPPLLLTIAAPAGPWHYANIEVDKIHQYLDWINLMCYDFHGPWGGSSDIVTNHHSGLYAAEQGHPLLNTEEAVRYYLDMGVPKEKLIVGVPFYGRSYGGVNDTPDGLFSTYTGPGSATTEEEGMVFFYDIKRNYLQSHQLFWDDQAEAPYLYSPSQQDFITFESEESLRLKCQRIKALGLAGIMFWEISLDTRPQWDLLNVINQELK